MKDVYEQVYFHQHNTMQVQDQPYNKKNSSNSSGSTVLGRFLKLGKSKSEAHGTSNNGTNLKRRHTPNSSNEFEDEFRLTPSQLRGVERMVHKANMKKDVSRSHSWIFGSVKLPSDMPPGYGYDNVYGGGRGSAFDSPTTTVSEYCTPSHSNMHIPRCQTTAEDYCCSCEYQEDFNFLTGTPSGTSGSSSSHCKACKNIIHEGNKYIKNGMIVGNRKYQQQQQQEPSKKFASSVRKLTWKSLKQAVKKRPSLDSLRKPTSDWLSSSNSPSTKQLASFSHEDLLTSSSSTIAPGAQTNYFFPDKKNGFYASCTDLHYGDVDFGQSITATASVRVRPKRSRQSWHFPNEFGPVPNYQEEEEAAVYHSEWDLRQYMPMPYEQWLTSTSPSSPSCVSNLQQQTKNSVLNSDFDACFEPPTSVKVSLNNNNNNNDTRSLVAKGNRPVSRGSNNNNSLKNSSTKVQVNASICSASHKGSLLSDSNSSSTDMYSNGGVKRFSILYAEASAYQLNKVSPNYRKVDENDEDDDQDDEDDDEGSSSVIGKGSDDQVRIAGQGIFMMTGNSSSCNGASISSSSGASVKVVRSNSSVSTTSTRHNLSRSNHPHHLLLTSSDGVWSDTQSKQTSSSNSSHSRDRVQLLPDKGMSNNVGLMEQSVSFTSFQQQSTFLGHSHYASTASSGSNLNGPTMPSSSSSKMTDGNGSLLNNVAAKNISNSSANNSNQRSNMHENDNSLTNNGNDHINNHYSQSEGKSRSGTTNQRREINNGEDFAALDTPSGQRSNNNSKSQFSESSRSAVGKGKDVNGHSGHTSDAGNKYGALRRRNRGRSGPGKNLLRETIYEEDSEQTDVDCMGDKEVYTVKIVVSQNGTADYVKPILKNRGQYAVPNVSSFYSNSNEVQYDQPFQQQQHQQNMINSNEPALRTRKKVQFNSEQVIVCGGLSEPELDLDEDEQDERAETDTVEPEDNDREHTAALHENLHESMSFNVEINSSVINKPVEGKEIPIGGMTKMTETMEKKTRKVNNSNNSSSSSRGTTNEEEVVQVNRVRLKTSSASALCQVNNLQQDLSKLNTNSSAAGRLVKNESSSSNNEKTSSRKNTTSPAILMTTTTNMCTNSSAPTIKALDVMSTIPATFQLKQTSDEERKEIDVQALKKTPHGSCSTMKAERIGINKEQTISKVKGCQPQKILNPNSLLFNDTTRIRLNQARPSLEQTFKINFCNEEIRSEPSQTNGKTSPPSRKVRPSHSFRGGAHMMQIPLRPKEPPPPPPVPLRSLPPIPTSAKADTEISLPKSNQTCNGYVSGHSHVVSSTSSPRSVPTNKSQISLPMPMLGFSTTNNNVNSSSGKPLTSHQIHAHPTASSHFASKLAQTTNRNKSLALAEKCEAIEKVLSQTLTSTSAPISIDSSNKTSSSSPNISKVGKTNSNSPQSLRTQANNVKSPATRPYSYPGEIPPPRPPLISPKPFLETSDNNLCKSKQPNQNQLTVLTTTDVQGQYETEAPKALNNNNNNYQTNGGAGESHSQNIEIVTKENSVSEIRIYSGTKSLSEQQLVYDTRKSESEYECKIVPTNSSPQHQNVSKEMHYAATDLFQKDGSFNFSNTSMSDQHSSQQGSSSTCSRPQSTSVILIVDTGSTDAEAAAIANSITKALKPNSSSSQCQATRPVDLLPLPQPQAIPKSPLPPLDKIVTTREAIPTMATMMSQRIEDKGVGQSKQEVDEVEPVYDDVINHSVQVELVARKESMKALENKKDAICLVSPPASPPPSPPALSPPPLGDNLNDNLYSDIDREDEDVDEDEDSGTCLAPSSPEENMNSLTEDIIYDDTLSIISNNYEMDLLKINNSEEVRSESIRLSPSKTKTKTKFLPVINHSKLIKKEFSSSIKEDEPMYDDVLNLISSSSIETTLATMKTRLSLSPDYDSGTETDSPPPLPTSGPPLHLLPKICMDLPLIPLPYSSNKKTFSEKVQDFGKKKSHGSDVVKVSRNDLPLKILELDPDPCNSTTNLCSNSKSTGTSSKSVLNSKTTNQGNETKGSEIDALTVSVQNRNQKLVAKHNTDDDDVLDKTRSLLNELNDKLSKLNFTSPDYSTYVSKVVISSSSESSGVEEDYNSEKNYSLSNGSDVASSGDDNYKLSAVSKLVTETISMARGKFLDSMKLNMIANGGGGTQSPVSDIEEPIYEEINESSNAIRGTSPIYSDAFDAKSIFDGASRNEILSFLESIRDRLTNAGGGTGAESNSDSWQSSLTKKTRKFGEIERNDSGIGSESGSLVAIGNSKNGRILESLCKDCNDAPVDLQIIPSTLDSGDVCNTEISNDGATRLELCRSCSRKRNEKKEIILEIYETEMKYGRDLRIVADEFYNPIQVAGLLTKEQLDQIFLNVTQLIEMNGELTSMLKTAIDEAITSHDEDLSSVTIGKIFLEIGEKMMGAFESYCTRQANAGALLTQLEKEKELLRIFLRVSQMENAVLRRMNLPAFLMVPVQRVTRYPLLLSRLLKVTCANHSSRDELQLAHEKIEQHLEHMNKTTREVASVKLWRRISIINGNNSPIHRRSGNDSDGANIRIRKMAFDVLDWANFTDVTCVIENQLNIVNLNGKSLRNIYGCLLARGKDLDNLAIKMDQDVFFPPAEDVVKDVKLVLVRVKNTRFCLLREPLCLSKCIVSQGENEFQDFIEINEITTKNTYYLQAMDKQGTSVWLRLLQCHAVCVGQWRRRRGALANIMMNGMIRHL